MKHIEPRLKAQGYVQLYKCKECNSVGSILELWSFVPCPECGGTVEEFQIGIWIPKTKTVPFLWFFERTVPNGGYWSLRSKKA